MRSILTLCFLVLVSSIQAVGPQQDASEEDKRFLEVPTSQIPLFAVNHQQGSISFEIDGQTYFYYIQSADDASRIQATSRLLEDIRNSSTIQFASVKYGLHRRIINLSLFYGDRKIPENLSPQQ
jgi:hypothetical protein